MTASDLAWQAVALNLDAAGRVAGEWHVIDHAWTFGFDSKETWGFVTEPYVTAARVQPLLAYAKSAMQGWPIQLATLPAEQSAWNPGQCVPIVATFEPNMMEALVRRALFWLLEREMLP